MDSWVLILVFLILPTYFLVIFRYLPKIMKIRTQINQLLIISYLFFGFGIIFDCYRIISITLFGFVEEILDKIGFLLKTFLTFLGISVSFQLIIVLSRQSGQNTKKPSFLNLSYISLSIIFFTLNGFTFNSTNINDIGFYTYQFYSLLYVIIAMSYIPLLFYSIYRAKFILKEIKNKKTIKQVKYFIFLFVIIGVEKIFNLGVYSLLANSIYILFIDLLMQAFFILGFYFTIFIKYPDFLDNISAYFCVKSIYLITNSGIIIYNFNFQKEDTREPISSNQLILGGFMHVITEGFNAILEMKGKVKKINIGNRNLLFKYGKYLLGILFISEYTPMLDQKLSNFIDKFESFYEKELKNWSGDISLYKSETIQNWIFEIFR